MTRKPSTRLRKTPCQQRSRATFDAVLEAAARVLVDEGFECATTNRIAEVAGVSVGSLYQYFPNKHSIVWALLERHIRDAEALRPPELRGVGGPLTLRERIRLAVEWHLAVHAADPALHRVLTNLVPEVVGAEAVRAFERATQRAVRDALEHHRDELHPASLDLAAFCVAQCLEALTHGAVVHHPELLEQPHGVEALAGEMEELLAGYLERDRGR